MATPQPKYVALRDFTLGTATHKTGDPIVAVDPGRLDELEELGFIGRGKTPQPPADEAAKSKEA